MRPVAVVGDALLDRDVDGRVERLAPDAPVPVLDERAGRSRPGGAALAATLLAGDGRPVVLVAAVGTDRAGRQLRRLLADAGVRLVDLRLGGPTPEKVRFCAEGRPLLRLDRGGDPAPTGPVTDAARGALDAAVAVLVADYGRGLSDRPDVRASLSWRTDRRRPVVWDPHPRGDGPLAGAALVTPNGSELAVMSGAAGPGRPGDTGGGDLARTVERARRLRTAWAAHAVAVTLGRRGALLIDGDGPPLAVPGDPVDGMDTCGAGDRFSSTAAAMLADGALPSEAVVAAVAAAGTFVRSGAAAALPTAPSGTTPPAAGRGGTGTRHGGPGPDSWPDPDHVVHRHRQEGGTVVATGGCFDLLHAGHVATLRAARSLGTCLVVCLNSDRSVRRLKGPGRPVVPEADRAAVLLALDCVDAVAVFDEDTPAAVLDRLRPDVFAKGGDYAGGILPETQTLARWGGQVVVLPYLSGRSTTALLWRVSTGPE